MKENEGGGGGEGEHCEDRVLERENAPTILPSYVLCLKFWSGFCGIRSEVDVVYGSFTGKHDVWADVWCGVLHSWVGFCRLCWFLTEGRKLARCSRGGGNCSYLTPGFKLG